MNIAGCIAFAVGMSVWADEDEEADTLPPPREGFTRCSKCTAQYDYDSFRKLEYVGVYPGPSGRALVLRNCANPVCHGTTQRWSDEQESV